MNGLLAIGQDGIVSGVLRHREALARASSAQVLEHNAFQRPPQPAPEQFRALFGRRGGVSAPHIPTSGGSVTSDRNEQGGRVRLVGS